MTSNACTGHVRPSELGAVILGATVSLVLACGGDGQDPMEPGDGGGSVTVQDVGLNVGESTTFTADGEVLALRLPSASSGREYRLAVQSADAGSPGLIPMRLTRGDGSSGSGSVSSSRRAAGAGVDLPPRARDLMIRRKIRESSRDLLVRRGISPTRHADSDVSSGGDIRLSSRVPTNTVPDAGDRIQFWFAAQQDFDTPCDTASARTVTAEVKEVGERAIIVQDTAAPEPSVGGLGGFSSTDFQQIAATFDTLVVPVDSAYFGSPTDIDGNDHVYILFTPKVNELDPADGRTRVGGFFVPNDLAESGDDEGTGSDERVCAASNESELLYLRSPDPNGDYGTPTSAERAKRNAFSVSSHELQHLLNAANRVIKQNTTGFGPFETTWLSEALSHLAEEVVGLAAYGASVRSNLTYEATAGSGSQTFDTYLFNDFFNAGAFMDSVPTTRALATSDPDGLQSLEMRGFGWLFARWLADQYASVGEGAVPSTGEEGFIRDLAQADGGLSTGIENVEEVTGASFDDLLADFAVMLAVDDDVDAADGQRILPTWDLRDMYRELAANRSGWRFGEYPLNPVETGFTDGGTDFEVRPGPGKHFTLSSSGSTPELEVRLTDQADNALSASARARIVIFRAR